MKKADNYDDWLECIQNGDVLTLHRPNGAIQYKVVSLERGQVGTSVEHRYRAVLEQVPVEVSANTMFEAAVIEGMLRVDAFNHPD